MFLSNFFLLAPLLAFQKSLICRPRHRFANNRDSIHQTLQKDSIATWLLPVGFQTLSPSFSPTSILSLSFPILKKWWISNAGGNVCSAAELPAAKLNFPRKEQFSSLFHCAAKKGVRRNWCIFQMQRYGAGECRQPVGRRSCAERAASSGLSGGVGFASG